MKVKEQLIGETERLRKEVAKLRQEKTERKQAERRLEESEVLGSSILNAVPHAVIGLRNRRIIFANSAVEAVFGWRPAELIGKTTRVLYRSDEESEKIASDFYPTLAKHQTHTEEFPCRRKDGRDIMCLVSTSRTGAHLKEKRIVAVYTDITERKQAEIALGESEEKYRTQFETAMDAIVLADVETGILLDCNRAACKLVGRKKSEIVGQHQRILHPPQEMEGELTTTFTQHLAEKEGKTLETQVITKKGEIKEVAIKANIIELGGKKLLQGIFRDITEHKQVEEELRRGEEKYRTILENVVEGYYEVDLAGNFTFVNDAICNNLGYTRDELLGMNNKDYMDKQTARKVLERYAEVYTTGQPARGFDFEVIKKDGTKLFTSVSISLIRDSKGEPTGFRGIVRDITEQEKAEEALQASEERYRSLFETATDGIFTLDLHTRFTSGNKRAEEMCGYSRDELHGKYATAVLPEEEIPLMAEAFKMVLKGEINTYETKIINKNGELIPVEVTSSPIEIDGEIIGTMGMVRDISARREAEEELRDSEERFRSVVEYSHEGILIMDGAYRFTYVNDELCRILEYPREEIIGRDFQEFLDADSRQLVADRYARRQRGEKIPPRYEFNIVRKNGEKRRVEISSTVIKDLTGKVMTVAQLLDITERKKAEIASEEARTRFEDLFESANELIITTDVEGWILHVNKEVERFSGYSKKELVGQSILNIAYPEDTPKYIQFWKDVLSGLTPRYELRGFSKIGNISHLLASASVIRKDGNIVEIQYNAKDITEEKQAEEELRKSEERYRTILENIEDGYYAVDLVGNFTFFNDSMCRILGYTRDEMMGMNNRQYMDKESARKIYQIFNSVYTTGKPVKAFDWEITRKDGTRRISEASVSLIRDAEGQRIGFRGVVRDVTERKETEKALQEAKTRFEDLFETANELIITTDAEGWVLHANKEVEKLSGYSKKELIGQSILNIAYPEDTPKYIQFWKDMLSGLAPHYQLRAISEKKPGEMSYLLASGSVIRKDGKIVEIQYNAKNITEEKQAEEELRQSEEKYRSILENITDGYYELDLAGNFTFFNDSMCKMLGYSKKEMMGMNNREYEDKENARKVYQAFTKVYATGKPVEELEFEVIRKDGTKGFIETSASPIRDAQDNVIGFRGVARDITERKQIEAERAELEKKAQLATRLSVVGEMASGIVHEINNPLTSVIGFAEMLAQKELPEDAKEYVTIINNEGKRVASIATSLLNFARHQKPETVYTDINKLIEATLELQNYEMTTGNIKVTTKLAPHLPRTMADPGQLQQVFLNIMLNARAAMRLAHGGGKLLIKTEAMDNTIRISFKDDGPGIAKKNLQRIFDPFFTTRKTGEGTGLGLSICQGIIASHDGTIYARSKLGKGATFIIELPVVARQRKTASNGRANHVNNNPWR